MNWQNNAYEDAWTPGRDIISYGSTSISIDWISYLGLITGRLMYEGLEGVL